jgi:hypothetical protein
MSYMLLVLQTPFINSTLTPEEGRHRYKIMKEYAQDLAEKGVLMGAEALGSERQSARLGKGTGGESVLDGPFIEAKEIVGGFFMLDVPTREEAIEFAKACPAVAWATVEVREVGPCWDEFRN